MSSMVSVQLDGRVAGALAADRWDQVVALVADGELAPDLSMVGLLASVDPHALDGDGRVDLIRAWDRVEAMVAGRKLAAVAAVIDATEGAGRPAEEARFEIGAALRLSPTTAGDRTMVALELRDRLPAALAGAARPATSPTCRPRTWPARSASCPIRRPPRCRPGCWAGRRSRPWPSSNGPSGGRCWPPTRPRPPTGTAGRSRPAPSRRCRSRTACSRSG